MRHVIGMAVFLIVTGLCLPLRGASVAPLTLDGKTVGSITVDKNTPITVPVGNKNAGGVSFLAHFDLALDFALQDCCTVSDLHWLQRAKTSKPQPGFTKTDFIDPMNGQTIGNGITGDNKPFYDLTYTSASNATNNTNRKADGSGSFLKDIPFNLLDQAPFTFEADSLVVCVHDSKMAILGGVHWGYTLNANGTITAATPSALSDASGLRDALNKDLKTDFAGFSFVSAAEICVPLPPAVWMSLSAAPMIAGWIIASRRGKMARET